MGNRTSRQDRNGKTTTNAGHSLNYRTSDFVDERGASVSPAALSATGGTEYEPGNGYKYHKFTTATPSPESKLIVSGSGVIDLLVVAGGGAGGSYYGAGGGGGGIAYANDLPVESGTYPVSVGPGATAHGHPLNPSSFEGNDGVNSYFGTPGQSIGGQPNYILAKGGGGGGRGTTTGGRTGGSGGGSGGGDPTPALGQATQPGTNPSPFVTDYGNPGGYSTPTGGYAPAGGGGAGAAGVDVDGDLEGGGNGGAGQPFPDFAYPLIGESALNPYSPSNSHYAGGGGAGVYSAATGNRSGIGGHGGGGYGPGSPTGPGVNKLGGGGGGRHPGTTANYVGGDGIVIVRYLN